MWKGAEQRKRNRRRTKAAAAAEGSNCDVEAAGEAPVEAYVAAELLQAAEGDDGNGFYETPAAYANRICEPYSAMLSPWRTAD